MNNSYHPVRFPADEARELDEIAEKIPANFSWLVRRLSREGRDYVSMKQLKADAKLDISSVRRERRKDQE